MRRVPVVAASLVATVWIALGATAAAQYQSDSDRERKAGSTDWLLTRVVRHDDEIYELGWHRRRGIEAYASHTSVKAGEPLTSTSAPTR